MEQHTLLVKDNLNYYKASSLSTLIELMDIHHFSNYLEARRWEGMRREEMGEERKGLLWCKHRNLVASTSNGCKCETTLINFHPPCYLMLVKPSSPLFLDFQTHLVYAVPCWCHWNSTICVPTACIRHINEIKIFSDRNPVTPNCVLFVSLTNKNVSYQYKECLFNLCAKFWLVRQENVIEVILNF